MNAKTYKGQSMAWLLWFWGLMLFIVCCERDRCFAQTSNVETVRAWTRTYIMGLPGGGLYDPTGTLADAQRMAAVSAVIGESSNIVSAAAAGLTNSLQRLVAVADRTNDFTGRLYIAADLDADPAYENVEGYIVDESIDDDAVTHYYVHYTRVLSVSPQTVWGFETSPGSVWWSAGTVATNNATTNVAGYACYDIAVARPPQVANIVLRTGKFLKFGAPSAPLDIPDAGLRLVCGGVTNTPFTGSVAYTNVIAGASNEIVEAYLSGFLYTVTTNSIGGI